jgi:hypothetical protein
MKRRFNPQPKPGTKKPGTRSKHGSQREPVKPHHLPGHARAFAMLKSKPGYVRCQFTLTLGEYRIIQLCMQERGLGPGNYNAALQTILAEWKALRDQPHHPVLMVVPADMLPKDEGGGEK